MMSDDRQARLAALAAKAGRLPRQSMDQDTDPDINSDNNIINNDSNHRAVAEKTKTKTLSFRNYVPKDASLDDNNDNDDDTNIQKDKYLPKKRQKTSNNNSASRLIVSKNTSTSHKSALEIALAKTDREARLAAGQSVDDDDAKDDHVGGGMWNTGSGIVAVTPSATKKVNWDLKRDIQQKMEKLEKRTQRAIVQLLRERLEKEAAMGMEEDEEEDNDID